MPLTYSIPALHVMNAQHYIKTTCICKLNSTVLVSIITQALKLCLNCLAMYVCSSVPTYIVHRYRQYFNCTTCIPHAEKFHFLTWKPLTQLSFFSIHSYIHYMYIGGLIKIPVLRLENMPTNKTKTLCTHYLKM